MVIFHLQKGPTDKTQKLKTKGITTEPLQDDVGRKILKQEHTQTNSRHILPSVELESRGRHRENYFYLLISLGYKKTGNINKYKQAVFFYIQTLRKEQGKK